jgi:hypothetical protein
MTAFGGFNPEAFRIVRPVQRAAWMFAVPGVIATRRRARRVGAARGIVPRPWRQVPAGMRS